MWHCLNPIYATVLFMGNLKSLYHEYFYHTSLGSADDFNTNWKLSIGKYLIKIKCNYIKQFCSNDGKYKRLDTVILQKWHEAKSPSFKYAWLFNQLKGASVLGKTKTRSTVLIKTPICTHQMIMNCTPPFSLNILRYKGHSIVGCRVLKIFPETYFLFLS